MSSKTADWNPQGYLKFKKERTQPSIDLVNRIDLENPVHVVDLGCGPGNSTEILLNRWPNSTVSGFDSSKSMIEKAQADYPNQTWSVADAREYVHTAKIDVLFANAVIQWIPDHKTLLPHLLNELSDNGVLAIQMPLYHEMPISSLIESIFESKYRKESSFDIGFMKEFNSTPFYFEILRPLVSRLDLWETHYFHEMDSHESILEMIRTTGMRPYLAQIETPEDQEKFQHDVLEALPTIYPMQENGQVLFPFKRMFIAAYK